MKLLLGGLMAAHGLIHLLGYEMQHRLLWVLAAVLLVGAAGMAVTGKERWWQAGIAGVALSQLMIFTVWEQAKAGTVVNVWIALAALTAWKEGSAAGLRRRFREEVERARAGACEEAAVVEEEDLVGLPVGVARYLRVCGVVGKPRVKNFRLVFTGEFRNGPGAAWMKFRSEQFNFVEEPARLFLMRASKWGVGAEGLHLYREGRASMEIRVATWWKVADSRGPEMDRSETVTYFNDLCCFAPAALLDKERVEWEERGEREVVGRFRVGNRVISARLLFGEGGELMNFLSEDRAMSADGKAFAWLPWSTPLREYRELAGRRVPHYGEAVWLKEEGEFVYGRFRLQEAEYNFGD